MSSMNSMQGMGMGHNMQMNGMEPGMQQGYMPQNYMYSNTFPSNQMG
jgi:hypothetical protein